MPMKRRRRSGVKLAFSGQVELDFGHAAIGVVMERLLGNLQYLTVHIEVIAFIGQFLNFDVRSAVFLPLNLT